MNHPVRWLAEDDWPMQGVDSNADTTLRTVAQATHQHADMGPSLGPASRANGRRKPAIHEEDAGAPGWLVQCFFAAVLVCAGYYATHHQGWLPGELRNLYQSALSTDYSADASAAVDRFIAAHRQEIPVFASLPSAIVLHVPLSGRIVADYAQGHPEMFIEGTAAQAVLAAGSGTVVRVVQSHGGDLIAIDHGHLGETVYMGLGRVSVEPGEYVASGQVIGRLPSARHPQLRFSLLQGGHAVNPHDYIHFPNPGA